MPPQPSDPQFLSAQFGVQTHDPFLQLKPLEQLPQKPPHPSLPQFFPEHLGVHPPGVQSAGQLVTFSAAEQIPSPQTYGIVHSQSGISGNIEVNLRLNWLTEKVGTSKQNKNTKSKVGFIILEERDRDVICLF